MPNLIRSAATLSLFLLFEAPAATLEKILVYDKAGWYVHPDIGRINDHFKKLGAAHGFQVDVSSDPAVFSAARLQGYDVVVLNNISEMGTSLSAAAGRAAFQAYVEGGGGLVAFHGSGVVRGTWDWYIRLLGTDWLYDAAMQEARVFVPDEAKGLPIAAGQAGEGRLRDEWNNFKVNVDTLAGFTVVLAIDESSYDPTRKKNPSEGNGIAGFRMADPGGKWVHPVSWIRRAGQGRVFYSCIGHDIQVMETPFATAHFLNAIRWAAGTLEPATGTAAGWFAGAAGGGSPLRALPGKSLAVEQRGGFVLTLHSPTGAEVFRAMGTGPALLELPSGLLTGVYWASLRGNRGPARLLRVAMF